MIDDGGPPQPFAKTESEGQFRTFHHLRRVHRLNQRQAVVRVHHTRLGYCCCCCCFSRVLGASPALPTSASPGLCASTAAAAGGGGGSCVATGEQR